MTRVDDVINVAGHRLSTGQIEEVLARHNDVAECAVIGVADELKGQVPLGFLVLKAGVNRPTEEIVRRGRPDGARPHRPGRLLQDRRWSCSACPRRARARSCAAPCRRIADGQPWTMPATIDDRRRRRDRRRSGRGYAGQRLACWRRTPVARFTPSAARGPLVRIRGAPRSMRPGDDWRGSDI